jgi:hypothetical protein
VDPDANPAGRPLETLGREKYLRLTTFRRDGTPVPTPVWVVPDGGTLLVVTTLSTGKVKRIRHTPRVLLAPCDARGRVAAGAVDTEAVATVVEDPAAVAELQRLLIRKYGLLARAIRLLSVVRRRHDGARLEITAA